MTIIRVNDYRLSGDALLARECPRQAFDCERQAADFVAADVSLEPTRSVLHRSAATLAVECGACARRSA